MKDKEEDKRMAATSVSETLPQPGDSTVSPLTPVHGVLIGTLVELSHEGQAHVSYPGNLAVLPVTARSTTHLTSECVGKEVALLFENGDIRRPIVVGVMHVPSAVPVEAASTPADEASRFDTGKSPDSTVLNEIMQPEASELIIDGRRIALQAREEIVLRCGKSSITMTSAGKVIIRGSYVSSKSSGANRIKGGSVQIN